MSVAGHDGAVAHTGGDGAGNSALKNRKKQEKQIEHQGRFLEFWGLQVEMGMDLEDVWRANSSWGLSAMLTVHLNPRDGHLAR